jgi:hypothetical protein
MRYSRPYIYWLLLRKFKMKFSQIVDLAEKNLQRVRTGATLLGVIAGREDNHIVIAQDGGYSSDYCVWTMTIQDNTAHFHSGTYTSDRQVAAAAFERKANIHSMVFET